MAPKLADVPRSDSERNLARIFRKSFSRKPLLSDTSEVSSTEALPGASEGAETKTDEPVSVRLRKPKSERAQLTADQSTIEAVFVEIQQDTARRQKRAKRADGSFRSNYADAASPLVTHTIFDAPYFKNSLFFGFYIFFWLSGGFLMLKNLVHAHFNNKTPIYEAPVFLIFTSHLHKIAAADLAMYLSIYVAYAIQYMCLKGWIQWHRTGRMLQSLYELAFTMFWIHFIARYLMRDQWIGRVFLVLHMFVLLMKMHSYSFYNGYLWKIFRELQFSESYLERIGKNADSLPEGYDLEPTKKLLRDSIAFCKFELLHQSRLLDSAREKGTLELTSRELCVTTLLKFPGNINTHNYFMYTMYPTVLYSLVFHRTKKINWLFVFEKVCAMLGVIFLMLVVADFSLYKPVQRCNELRNTRMSAHDRLVLYLLTLVDIIPPLMVEYIFVFYLIWDTILNLIAELSMFADRDFYGPWWSCTDWSEYARLWNKPVHNFLLRHVYHLSISALSLSKNNATLMTFFISSVVHEVVMHVIFRRWRGFLFLFQMGQIPLVLLSKTPFMLRRKVLGNVICWFGFVTGPAIIFTLYLVY